MGTDGRRYDIQRRKLKACDTIYRDGNNYRRYDTEKGTDGRRYDIQRWELMTGDTIYRYGN